jgi:hypothetical protein
VSAAFPGTRSWASVQRRPPVAVVAALVCFAGVAGLVLGSLVRSERPQRAPTAATPPAPIAHTGLSVQLPSGWARGDAAAIPGFKRPLGLRNEVEGLRAALELLPAASPSLMPAALGAGSPERVELRSGYEAWRYRSDGAGRVAFALPTTTGIATVACVGATDVARRCQRLASSVVVPDSRPLDLSRRAALFSRLPELVPGLNAERARGLDALRSATRATAQAAAADRLARAHKVAAAALAPLATPGEKLPATLAAAARAYATLAGAARERVPGPYTDAARAVTGAEADLRRAMTEVAAAAQAASRDVSTRPVFEPDALAPVSAEPAGADLTLPLLGLLTLVAGFLCWRAVREARPRA